jgi:hypothetical protein
VTFTVASVVPDAAAAGEALLATVVAGLSARDVAIPDRTGLVPGDAVPWDCDQLVVNFMGLSRGQPALVDQTQTGALLPSQTIVHYEFRITLLRKVATISGRGNPPKLPSIDTLSADFATIAGDARDLALTMIWIHQSYLMVPPSVPFAWGPVAPIGPEGALAGVVCPVSFMAGRNADGGF